MNETTLHRPTSRVLDILECLAPSDDGLTLTEIASETGASKSTIFPIIKSLVSRKYVHFDDKSLRYSLGVASCVLSGAPSRSNLWLRLINDEMQGIVNACDEVCQLGMLDGTSILYVLKVETRKAVRLVSHVGKRLPAVDTALGKAILCEFTERQLKELYPSGLPAMTKYSVKTFDALRRQLSEARKLGYAVENRESDEETKCYAVPLRHHQAIVAAMSVSVPIFRDNEKSKEIILGALFNAKRHIEDLFDSSKEIGLFSA